MYSGCVNSHELDTHKNCRDQCFDGASSMPGAKSGMATQIKPEEPRAIYSHCYGHSLQLAVGDILRKSKNLKDDLNTTSEISKLLKVSKKKKCETLLKFKREPCS